MQFPDRSEKSQLITEFFRHFLLGIRENILGGVIDRASIVLHLRANRVW